MKTVEIGSKNEFFGRRLRLNLAAFYNDYANLQLDSEDPLPYQGGITNIPKVHTYGIEAEAFALLPHDFRLNATFAAMDGAVDSHLLLIDPIGAQTADRLYGVFTPADLAARAVSQVDAYDKTPGKLPPFTATLSLGKTFRLPGDASLSGEFRYSYRAPYYFRVFNNDRTDKVPESHQLDFDAKYQSSSFWAAELIVVNVTDSDSVNSRVADNFGVGEVANIYVPPRQIIARLSYRF